MKEYCQHNSWNLWPPCCVKQVLAKALAIDCGVQDILWDQKATNRLYITYLVGQPIENLQTDNGSEFAWEFERASAGLGVQRYFSRVKTPKDNLEIERFNQTLGCEWLYNSNLSLDPEELDPRLTECLLEYDFNPPHQSLAYLAPVEYVQKQLAKMRSPVLPVWSASTIDCQNRTPLL